MGLLGLLVGTQSLPLLEATTAGSQRALAGLGSSGKLWQSPWLPCLPSFRTPSQARAAPSTLSQPRRRSFLELRHPRPSPPTPSCTVKGPGESTGHWVTQDSLVSRLQARAQMPSARPVGLRGDLSAWGEGTSLHGLFCTPPFFLTCPSHSPSLRVPRSHGLAFLLPCRPKEQRPLLLGSGC